MIGKVSIGRSFKGCVLYCMEDKKQKLKESMRLRQTEQLVMKGRAELVHYNMCYGDKHELIQQFNGVRGLNPKLSKPVLHITLSLSPEDHLQKGKLSEMAEECARQMGFQNNQYIAIYHKDTGHQHLHIVANRIGFDGKTVSDSHNYQKISRYCRGMELKLGLRQVLSPRRYLSQKERLIERHDIRKEELKERIKLSIRQSRSYLEFEHRMKQYNYEVIRGRGIAFRDAQKVYVKGSELGYSLATIEKQLKMQLVQRQSMTEEQKHFLSLQQSLDKKEKQTQTEKNTQRREHRYVQQRDQKFERKKDDDDMSEGIRNKPLYEKILDVLMEPIHENQEIPYELEQEIKLKHQRKQKISH
ncbi:MAG TPA: relaxase/mobilization nuclease domain-containing protein [Puia sp.]|jgi:hypothetical protein|nr:relaxase/mobilization nuclease domain-containing protein [Puia sp.]